MKILVVGYGSIGKRHVKNILKHTNHQIIICTKRQDLSSLNQKRIKIFDTLQKCLNENPEIGFITNETAYHIPVSKKLANVTEWDAPSAGAVLVYDATSNNWVATLELTPTNTKNLDVNGGSF